MELRPIVPNPVGKPVTAALGANCEVVRQGVFTALVQVLGIFVAGEAKIGAPSLSPVSVAPALPSTMVNGKPLRKNQLLERDQPPKTALGPHLNPVWRNMSFSTMFALK